MEDVMMWKRRRWPTLMVAVVAGATGVAYATGAVTSATTTIQACKNNVNGLLRVVSDASACRTDETAISWNVQGPQGPPGPQGEPGPQGPAGAAGTAVAYARVDGAGTLDTTRSLNIDSVTRVAIGTSPLSAYCFRLSVNPKNVVATVENTVFAQTPMPGMPPPPPGVFGMGLVSINATVDSSVAEGWSCPAGTNSAVAMSGAFPFYVAFN
jgi:hypothetical protein